MSQTLVETQFDEAAAEARFERRRARIEEAFERLYAPLFDYALQLTRHPADAEDLVSEAFRHAVTRAPEDRIGSLAWQRKNVFHRFCDRRRYLRRRPEIGVEELPEVAAPVREVAFNAVSEARLKQKFWSEFPGLDLAEQECEALWLTARYGFTLAETSRRMGVPVSTLHEWIAKGRERLAEYLEKTD